MSKKRKENPLQIKFGDKMDLFYLVNDYTKQNSERVDEIMFVAECIYNKSYKHIDTYGSMKQDLIYAGVCGGIKKMLQYQEGSKAAFSTYIYPYVKREMRMIVEGEIFQVKEHTGKQYQFISKMAKKNGIALDINNAKELSVLTNLSEKRIVEVLKQTNMNKFQSLEYTEILKPAKVGSPDKEFINKEQAKQRKKIVNSLLELIRTDLSEEHLVFFKEKWFDGMKTDKISEKHGVPRKNVVAMLNQCLYKCKHSDLVNSLSDEDKNNLLY